MAAIFPESLDRLDKEDVAGSLASLEGYIRYMTERMEFFAGNMNKNVAAETAVLNALAAATTALEARVAALETASQNGG